MKNITLIILISLIFVSCKKEKTIINPPKNEPEVDYREKYLGEYNCSGYYNVYFDKNRTTFEIDTFDITYNILKSGDSSIVIENQTLKIDTEGFFGPRAYNVFYNLPHGRFHNDTSIFYSKDLNYYDSINGKGFKRLNVGGFKKKQFPIQSLSLYS